MRACWWASCFPSIASVVPRCKYLFPGCPATWHYDSDVLVTGDPKHLEHLDYDIRVAAMHYLQRPIRTMAFA